jgi:hypothetical protein
MLADGATWATGILLANTLSCLSIAIYSAIKGNGVWSTGVYDFVLFGLGVLGLILWQALGVALIALIFAIIADFSFGLPTIIKTYKDPSSETSFVWIAAVIAGAFGVMAVGEIAFHELAYPLYLLLFDLTVVLLVLKIIQSRKTSGTRGMPPAH